MPGQRPRIALITGAGFSKALGGPTTTDLARDFLREPELARAPADREPELERAVTGLLRRFWSDVFGWEGEAAQRPSLGDHFTVIDLAANAGHNLGVYYSPRRLRAVRRLSLHRVFGLLAASRTNPLPNAAGWLRGLRAQARLGIVSLNWDTLAEEAAGQPFDYRPRTSFWAGQESGGTRVLKLHGSANWTYCDACRVLDWDPGPAMFVRQKVFLDPDDLVSLGADRGLCNFVREIWDLEDERRAFACRGCGARVSTRVGTFSYRKDYALGPFRSIWYSALRWLIMSDAWLFVGYSMPEADFEFRHILKTAQMAGKRPSITAVLGPGPDGELAERRYRQFFGDALTETNWEGWEAWAANRLEGWARRLGESNG